MQVLIIAPSMALRVGLAAMLQGGPADQPAQRLVCVEAASIGEALPLADQADVILLAADAWSAVEVERLAALKSVGGLLVLSDQPENAAHLVEAWGGPAWGVLSGSAGPEELAAALAAIDEGLVVGPARLLRQVLAAPPAQIAGPLPASQGAPDDLTGREREVLQCLAQGLANKQIGLALGISEHTVKFHVSAVYTKLGAASRTEAVRLGLQKGLISL